MDFALQHKGQLAIVTALVVYSAAKNKLTPGGIAAAIVTAGIHMIHPWGVFFNLLVGFFVAGTVGTKVCVPDFLSLPRTWDDILFVLSRTRGQSDIVISDFHIILNI